MKTSLFACAFVAAGLASAAVANPVSVGGNSATGLSSGRAVLWNQAISDGSASLVDQDFSDFPSFSTYMVDDFSTGGQTWNVSSVDTFFTVGFGRWDPSITSASLNFYAKTGSMPGAGDSAPEYTVPVTLTNLGSFWQVTGDTTGVAELQGINGDFWIGLSPQAAFGTYGQEFHVGFVGNVGDNAAMRNPGGGFGFAGGTGWQRDIVGVNGAMTEMAFVVNGEVVPAPASMALLGLAGLATGRRRR